MKFSTLCCCPFCGCTNYYTKNRVHGIVRCYQSFFGEEVDNTQMYDSLDYEPNERRYCADCDKLLGYADKDVVSKQVEDKLRKINKNYLKNLNT